MGCTSVPGKQSIMLSDFKRDFPVSKVVSLKPIQTFDIASNISSFMVKDSVIFVIEHNSDNLGHCYSLNSGEQISVILGRGKADNEFPSISYISFLFQGDSIQFYNPWLRMMKVFATQDVYTKPLGEREFSTVVMPNNNLISCFSRIGENMYIGSFCYRTKEQNDRYFLYDKNGFTSFGDFEIELFDTDTEVNDITMKFAFDPSFARYGDKVVTVNNDGILLQTIDLNEKIIENQKYYNKIKLKDRREENQPWLIENEYSSGSIRCDEEYVYFALTRRDDEKSEEVGKRISDKYILVFDWNLNPITKYDLGSFDLLSSLYYFSEDGKVFYYLTVDNEEKHVLYKGKIE